MLWERLASLRDSMSSAQLFHHACVWDMREVKHCSGFGFIASVFLESIMSRSVPDLTVNFILISRRSWLY